MHEFVWNMYCVPNSAQQNVQAHWECVTSQSVLARFVVILFYYFLHPLQPSQEELLPANTTASFISSNKQMA